MTPIKDNQTLEQLRQRDEAAFQLLYRAYFPMIERMVLRNNGTSADAHDLFQDTLLVLVKKLDSDDFALTASLKTYLYAIAQRQWRAKLREQARAEQAKTSLLAETIPALAWDEPKPDLAERVSRWLNQITAHCQSLLRLLFFADTKPTQTGYKNAHTARNQQYKCLQQVRRAAANEEWD